MRGFVRPKPVVVRTRAIVSEATYIVPAPNQFSHALVRRQPYFWAQAGPPREPDGYFARGTRVLVLARRGRYCRVSDRRGLYVAVECSALRALT